jgi:hypothetical protein
MHSEYRDTDPSDHSEAADVLVREEPDDEEDDEERDEGDGDEDYDDQNDDGYSE